MKKSTRKQLATSVLFVSLLTTTSFGVNAATIKGAQSCGVWIEDREAKRFPVQAWVIGYLSGIASATDSNFLQATDLPSIALWVDKFCRANPLKDISDAGNELARELMARKPK